MLGPPVGADAVVAHGWSGAEARLQATVCADPPPRKATWLWGSLRLDTPNFIGKCNWLLFFRSRSVGQLEARHVKLYW